MAKDEFKMGDYNTVPERIAEFRAKYPHGSLRPVDEKRPYWLETIGEHTFIVYAAVAMRSCADSAPGIGLAWEPFPGKTNFTRDSELQNAETSAWGRAIVAVLAADTKKGIATAEEVQNRREAEKNPLPKPDPEAWFTENGWMDRAHHDDFRKLLRDTLAATPDGVKEAFRLWVSDQTEAPPWKAPWPKSYADAVARRLDELRQTMGAETPSESQKASEAPEPHPDPVTPAPAPYTTAEADVVGPALVEYLKGLPDQAVMDALLQRGLADTGMPSNQRRRLGAAMLAEGWRPEQDTLLDEGRPFDD